MASYQTHHTGNTVSWNPRARPVCPLLLYGETHHYQLWPLPIRAACPPLTSAERGREVPGCAIPRADDAGKDGVPLQDVAWEAAVPDLVSYVESCSMENAFQYFPRISTCVARQNYGEKKKKKKKVLIRTIYTTK